MRHFRLEFLLSLSVLFLGGFSSPALARQGATKLHFTTPSAKARQLFEQGLAKYDRAELKAAAPLFHQSMTEDPQFALAQLFYGLAGDSTAHIRKAAQLTAQVTEPERWLIESWHAQLNSQLVKAVEHMEQAIKLLPNEPRLLVRLAQLYNATGRRDEAISALKRAIATQPTFGPAYKVLGDVHLARRDFAEAIAAREGYVKAMPDAADAYQALAHAHQQMQQFPKAVEYYTRALELDPDYINVYRRRGDAKFFAGDVAGARTDYKAGLERAKGADRPGLLFAAAFTYVHEGEMNEAAKYYEQAIAIAVAEGESLMISSGWDALGRSYLEAGRLIEAARAYRNGYEAAMRSPDFPPMEKLLWEGRYRHARGRILAKLGEFDAALQQANWIREQLEKAGNPNPGYMKSYHYLVGYILLEKGDYAGALAELKQANVDDVFIKLLLARVYLGLGDRASAERLMTEIANYTLGSVPSSIARPQALKWLKENKAKAGS